jgi:hypothetical protein
MNSERRPDRDRSPEALKAQLRALPQPPVPSHLEARLLVAVPSAVRKSQRRRTVRAAFLMLGVAAAACVLTMLVWRPHLGQNPGTISRRNVPAQVELRPPSFDPTSIAALRGDHRLLDEEKLPAFSWPLENAATPRALSPIPADLLD